MSGEPKHLKRIVIKEEFVALTGDIYKAVLLNQFIYWSQRVKDFDKYLSEEEARTRLEGKSSNVPLTNGWIYKSAQELSEEMLLGLSHQTMGRHLQALIDSGYLLWRHNPDHAWDRTKQYRVDFIKLRDDLHALGYPLDGFRFMDQRTIDNGMSITEHATSRMDNGMSITEHATSRMDNGSSIKENATSRMDNGSSIKENATSNMVNGLSLVDNRMMTNGQAIPEITTEITSEKDDLDGNVNNHDPAEPTGPQQDNHDPFTEVDFAMQKHTGNARYIAKEGDYRAIRELLESGVPLDFILSGIDYTFEHYADKNPRSFTYCAAVVKRLWGLELEKAAKAQPVDWTHHQGRRRSERQTTGQTARDERYTAFYELFPDA